MISPTLMDPWPCPMKVPAWTPALVTVRQQVLEEVEVHLEGTRGRQQATLASITTMETSTVQMLAQQAEPTILTHASSLGTSEMVSLFMDFARTIAVRKQ